MNTIDLTLLIFIGLLATFGFIRGVVSQAMSIVGLVAAYFFATPLSVYIVPKMAVALGSNEAYARPFSVLWSAIIIYIGCRLIGFAVEKILVDQSDSLKMMNRLGGGLLGAIKGCLILLIAFYILRFIPHETLEARAPKISQSQLYQFFSKNQLLDPKYIETLAEPVTKPAQELMEKLPTQAEQPKSVTEPKSKKVVEKIEKDMNQVELNKVLQKHAPKKKTKN